MTTINVEANYEQVEEVLGASKPLMEEADYDVQVVSVEEATSKAGNEMLIWEFNIINNPEHNGRDFKLYTPLPKGSDDESTKKAFSFFGTIKAMGWKGGEVNTEEFIGKECKGKIVTDKFTNDDEKEVEFSRLNKVF